MGNYQQEREQRMGMTASVIGTFTLVFMYIALLGLPPELSFSSFGFALIPLLFYVCCVMQMDKYQLLFPESSAGRRRCAEYLQLTASMLMVAAIVQLTGGAHSRYKLLFLPVALLYSLQFGLGRGLLASSIAAVALFIFTWQVNPGTMALNTFLEVDLVIIGVLFLVNWLVAESRREWDYSNKIVECSREQSLKIAAMEEMAAATAHEIKNPLTSLRGCLQMLQHHCPQEENPAASIQQRNYIDIMLTEVDRLNRIVSNMLLFTQPIETPIEVIDLNEIVREMAMLLGCRAELDGVELRVNLERGPQWVGIDPGQIKQVILNIAGNAFDAICGSGVINMVVKGQGQQIQLVIGDNGPGIPPENLDRIFEPFFTAQKEGGTGLGLTIVERLVHGNGGKLSVSSKLGRGSVFTLEFPRAEGRPN